METHERPYREQDPFDPPSSASRSTPGGADADGGISILDMMVVVVRRRRMVLLVTLLCLVISVLLAFLLPVEYSATVLVMPPHQNSSLATMLESQLGNLGSIAALGGEALGVRNPNDMYVAMLRSEIVENGMIHRFDLMKEYHKQRLSSARKALEKHVDIDGTGKDGLIHISVEDRNPRRAAQLANGYVDQFRQLSQQLAASGAGHRADFFQQQLQQAQNNLSNAEEALKTTEQTTGLIDLSSQARALIESAATLRAQIAAKKVQIQALRTFASSGNTQLQQAQQELASLQAQIAELGGSHQNPNSLIVPKGMVPEAGLEYARKLRDVKYDETIFELLARQYELARLEQAKEGAMIQVVSPAYVPDHRSFPPRALMIVGGVIGGLFLGILAALSQAGWERLREDPVSGAKIALLRDELRRRRQE